MKSREQWQRETAIKAAKLRAQGWTTRNIAECLGIAPEVVKARVILGERLMQERDKES